MEVLWDWHGVPPGKVTWPVEILWDWDGVPPGRLCDQWEFYGMEVGTSLPWESHVTSGSIKGWRWGTLPSVNRLSHSVNFRMYAVKRCWGMWIKENWQPPLFQNQISLKISVTTHRYFITFCRCVQVGWEWPVSASHVRSLCRWK